VSRRERIVKELIVEPGTEANIAGRDPAWTGGPEFEELSAKELSHTAKALPERGRIGIFNRSHYEEVVALRVHPEWLDKQRLPPGQRGPEFWAGRHEDINAFERHLDRSGTKVVKFFLNVSRAEQKRASSPASTSRASSGSSARPTCPNGRTGTSTCGPSRRRSRPPQHPGRPGT
jgi:hypothetical protein